MNIRKHKEQLFYRNNFGIKAALLALLCLTTACANNPPQSQDAGLEQPTDTVAAEDKQQSAESSAVDAKEMEILRIKPERPEIELSGDILYKLLLAEIAGHRGKLDVSVDNYLELARQTMDPEVIERATRISVYARDNEAATEAASLWAKVDPDSPDAHQVLAVMAIRAGNIDKAIEHLEVLMDPAYGKLDQKLWMIANFLGREKDQEIVLQVLERLMAKHQDNVDAMFAYAHVITRMGNMDKAEEILERVLELSPDNENVAISYVTLLQRQDKTTEALSWLENKLKENSADNFNLHLTYARLLADARRYEEARREFEILVEQKPNNTDILYALGLLYMESEDIAASEKYFKRLALQKGRRSEANYYLGRIEEDRQNDDKAAGYYQFVEQSEHYLDAQTRLALILARQNKVDKAREHLRSIPVNNEQEANLLLQVEAEMLVELERYEEARDVFTRELEKKFNPDLLYSRAMLAEKMNRLDLLEQDLKLIIEQDPNNAQALNALGYTLADRTERYEEAHEYIRRALEVSPDDFYILDSMGWVLYRLGRLDEAVGYLRRAMQLNPDPEIAAHLGEVLWVLGDKQEARNIWETALQETPDDSHLLEVLERFPTN